MTTRVAVPREAVTPRAEAESGRVFWQPRKWPFWAYVGLVAVATALWYSTYRVAGVLPWWVTTIAVVFTIALGVLMVLLIRWLDMYRGTPAALLVGAFVWGGVVGVGCAVVANDNLLALAPKLFGPDTGTQWGPSFSAPLVEETLKTVGIVTVILIGREFVRRPAQGMFIGAFCGLGFQLAENMLYAVQGMLDDPASDTAGMFKIIMVRSATALDSHWLYSAIAGLGIGYVLTRRDRSWARRLLVAVPLFAIAWWMHFASDSPVVAGGSAGAATFVLVPGKTLLNLLLGFIVYRIAMRAEWRHYAAAVGAEPGEVITPAEVESMRTHRSRRRARKRHRAHGGKPAKRIAWQLQRSQLQLANDVETDPAAAARTRTRICELRSGLLELNAGRADGPDGRRG